MQNQDFTVVQDYITGLKCHLYMMAREDLAKVPRLDLCVTLYCFFKILTLLFSPLPICPVLPDGGSGTIRRLQTRLRTTAR